ncbi:MAG: hypothetical protein JWP35_121 [Caulobacter sp.]|nr:hypothetical protein [Caulobacter sp.]
MVTGIDSSVLLSYYQARAGVPVSGAASTGTAAGGAKKYAPTAPWSTTSSAPKSAELVKQALLGRSLIDENAAQLDLPGASADYKKLFALYQGLNALYGLADKANGKNVSALEATQIKAIFNRGMKEVVAYADAQKLDQVRLTRGDAMTSDKSAVGVPKNQYDYVGRDLFTGTATDVVPSLSGAVSFSIQVKKVNTTANVAIDLTGMGATPRTMPNVVNFINDQLIAAGVSTRVATNRTPGVAKTVQAGGKTITLPATGDTWGLKVKGVAGETLTFGAAAPAPAVYVTTASGNPDPDKKPTTDDAVIQSALMKIDSTGAAGGAPGSRVFTDTLEGTISTVRASKVGPDGSIYMLADVDGTVDTQTLKGAKDVALLKYDGAGNLLYARTLGASASATGLGLSVAADGRVAVSGSVTGGLTGATNGPVNSTDASGLSDSFVSLYDAKGDETWTQRRGASGADEAQAVGFGADGIVYVAGRTKTAMPGATALGGWDNYLSAIGTDLLGKPRTLFTQQYGAATDDKVSGLAVNGGQVVVAGVENGHGVLRAFDVTDTLTTTQRDTDAGGNWTNTVTTTTGGVVTGTVVTNGAQAGTGTAATKTTTSTTGAAAVAGAVRDLGDLQGGTLAGITLDGGNLWVAGDTTNAALSVGGQTAAFNGGRDAFAARISTDLSSTGQDALAYYGGAGNDTVTAMAASGGKVWVVGAPGDAATAGTPIGTKDGYLAQIDVASGTVDNAQRLSGKDGFTTATSVSVGATGASVLDKLGLPTGGLDYSRSLKITSATSARPGDTFQVRTSEGGSLATVTLDANDTLDTLAAKVRRAAGFKATVEVVSNGDTRSLKISPLNDAASVEILAGKGGTDLLASLGLKEGVVRNTTVDKNGKTVSADGKGNVYGLNLPNVLSLASSDDIKNTLKVLSTSLSKIRTAYADLQTAAMPQAANQPGKSGGTVPAYLTNQIANYQAALDRLTGGQ